MRRAQEATARIAGLIHVQSNPLGFALDFRLEIFEKFSAVQADAVSVVIEALVHGVHNREELIFHVHEDAEAFGRQIGNRPFQVKLGKGLVSGFVLHDAGRQFAKQRFGLGSGKNMVKVFGKDITDEDAQTQSMRSPLRNRLW